MRVILSALIVGSCLTQASAVEVRYADRFPGASIAEQVAAAAADCGAGNPCTIVIPADARSGPWNAAKLANTQTVIDYRPSNMSNPWDQFQQKGMEATTATALTHARQTRRVPVGFSWSARFLAGGVNRNDATGAKDHYNPFTFTSIDFGENEGTSFTQFLAKNGRGDAFGAAFATDASNNCMDGGDECSAALTGTLKHNPFIPEARISGVAPASPGHTLLFEDGYDTAWVGQSRLVIDTSPSKVYGAGTIAGMTKGPVTRFAPYGDQSIADTDGTTVTGSGVGWSKAFCGGARSCDGTDYCFELVPDRLAIDLGKANARYYDAAPGKLVYPIRKFLSDTTLQLNPQMQGYLENYLGPSTTGSYRIYPCGSIYEVATLSDNKQSPATGTLQVTGYEKWAASDRFEVPHPYANWGSVLKLYGQHLLDGKYASEMITVYDHVDHLWPAGDPHAPRTYKPFGAILGGAGEFINGVDFWGMLFDGAFIRSATGDLVFGQRCDHWDAYTETQCARREKRFDGSEIPDGHPNQRQSEYYHYTYESPTGTYADGLFHVGPVSAYTHAADQAAAKNVKPRFDVAGLGVYSNGSIATGGASGTADTSVYVHAQDNAYGVQVNMAATSSPVFPMVIMRDGAQKLEVRCDAGTSAPCTMRLRQGTEIAVEDARYDQSTRIGDGYVSVGAQPAATGAVRLASEGAVVAREGGRAADVNLVKLNASNMVELADATHVALIPSSATAGGFQLGAAGTRATQMVCGSAAIDPPSIEARTTGVGSGLATGVAARDACTCSPRTDWNDDLLLKGCFATPGALNVRLYNADAQAIDAGSVTVDFCCITK